MLGLYSAGLILQGKHTSAQSWNTESHDHTASHPHHPSITTQEPFSIDLRLFMTPVVIKHFVFLWIVTTHQSILVMNQHRDQYIKEPDSDLCECFMFVVFNTEIELRCEKCECIVYYTTFNLCFRCETCDVFSSVWEMMKTRRWCWCDLRKKLVFQPDVYIVWMRVTGFVFVCVMMSEFAEVISSEVSIENLLVY